MFRLTNFFIKYLHLHERMDNRIYYYFFHMTYGCKEDLKSSMYNGEEAITVATKMFSS